MGGGGNTHVSPPPTHFLGEGAKRYHGEFANFGYGGVTK